MKNQQISYLKPNQNIYLTSGDSLEQFKISGMQIKELDNTVKIFYKLRSMNPENSRETGWLSRVEERMWASEEAYFNRCSNDIRLEQRSLDSFLRGSKGDYDIEGDADGYLYYTGCHCEDGVVTTFKEPVGTTIYLEPQDAFGYKILPQELPEQTYRDMDTALTVCDTKVLDENGTHIVKSPKTLLALSEEQQEAIDEAMAAMNKARAMGVRLMYDDGDGNVYAVNGNGLDIECDEDYDSNPLKEANYQRVSDMRLVSTALTPLSFTYKSDYYCLWVKETPEKTEKE